jgi:hypothetical protein
MIRAKFKVSRIAKVDVGNGNWQEEVSMQPVYGTSDENKQWSKFTPSGELKMNITAEGAVGQFELGKEYFIDFTPAASA